jgi:hypothetical protein
MKNTKKIKDTTDLGNEDLADVSGSFYDEEGWNALGEDEGEGGECCGKNMVELGVTYTCLKCGNWEYSSS